MASFKCTLIPSKDEISNIKLDCIWNTSDIAGEVVVWLLWAQESEGKENRWQRNSQNEKNLFFALNRL